MDKSKWTKKHRSNESAIKRIEVYSNGQLNFKIIRNDSSSFHCNCVHLGRKLLSIKDDAKSTINLADVKVDPDLKACDYDIDKVIRLLLFYVSEASK